MFDPKVAVYTIYCSLTTYIDETAVDTFFFLHSYLKEKNFLRCMGGGDFQSWKSFYSYLSFYMLNTFLRWFKTGDIGQIDFYLLRWFKTGDIGQIDFYFLRWFKTWDIGQIDFYLLRWAKTGNIGQIDFY